MRRSTAAPPLEKEIEIGMPFNVRHEVHVDSSLAGLPAAWSAASAAGERTARGGRHIVGCVVRGACEKVGRI